MGLTRKLSYNPITKITEWFVSRDNGTFDIVMEHDDQPAMEQALESRNQFRGTGGWKGDDYIKVGWIPPTVVQEMMVNGTWGDPAALRKWANSADAQPYRYKRGRI